MTLFIGRMEDVRKFNICLFHIANKHKMSRDESWIPLDIYKYKYLNIFLRLKFRHGYVSNIRNDSFGQ